LASLDPRIRPAPLPIKLNGFDEPTQPEVSMTESHTRCASRGKGSTFGTHYRCRVELWSQQSLCGQRRPHK